MKVFRTLFLLAVCCTAGGWQAWAQESASPLQFKEESWDFGQIKETDGNVSYTFVFTNRGREPFVIERVATTCGCTTPEYTRAPVLAGRTGTVKVTYDPTGRPGAFNKNITVTLHDGTQAKLLITGTVIGQERRVTEEYPVEVGQGLRASRQTVGLGYLAQGNTKGTGINYVNDSGTTLTLGVEYATPHPYFAVTFAPQTVPPGGKGVMSLQYDLRNQTMFGRVTDNFYVTVNGIRTKPLFQATGIVTEDFSKPTPIAEPPKPAAKPETPQPTAQPPKPAEKPEAPKAAPEQQKSAPKADFSSQYYHFGDVPGGIACTHEFTVTNSGQDPLVIQKITAEKHIQTTLAEGTTVAPGGKANFTVTLLTQDLPEGRIMENLTIIMNDPERPMRELRLAAVIYY